MTDSNAEQISLDEELAVSESEKPESDQLEKQRIVLYRSAFDAGPAGLAGVLLLIASIPLSFAIPASVQYINLGRLFDHALSLPIPLFALPPIVMIVCAIHRLYNCRYVISHDHVLAVAGLLSMSMKDTRIDYENVRGIEIVRSLSQRIFDVGDLKVGSSMQDQIEIEMRGIRQPNKYRELIERRIRKYSAKPAS